MRGWFAAVIAVLLPLNAALAQTAQSPAEGLPPDPRSPQRLAAPQRQVLATVARNSATAQQLGTLAGVHAEPGRLAQLAQEMALTNSDLSRELAQLSGPENLPLRQRLDDTELARMRALATSDRPGFGRALLGWITRTYPDTITGIDTLGRSDPRYAALADAALPRLREQLAAAQQLAQAAMEEGGREAH